MCYISEIIVENKDGYLSKCKCGLYFVNYKNLMFEFDERELKSLRAYLLSVDVDYWYQKGCATCVGGCRKIPIPTQQGNMILIFNKIEFNVFKNLVFAKKETHKPSLTFKDIDKKFSLN